MGGFEIPYGWIAQDGIHERIDWFETRFDTSRFIAIARLRAPASVCAQMGWRGLNIMVYMFGLVSFC